MARGTVFLIMWLNNVWRVIAVAIYEHSVLIMWCNYRDCVVKFDMTF